MPGCLEQISWLGVSNDLTSESRLEEDGSDTCHRSPITSRTSSRQTLPSAAPSSRTGTSIGRSFLMTPSECAFGATTSFPTGGMSPCGGRDYLELAMPVDVVTAAGDDDHSAPRSRTRASATRSERARSGHSWPTRCAPRGVASAAGDSTIRSGATRTSRSRCSGSRSSEVWVRGSRHGARSTRGAGDGARHRCPVRPCLRVGNRRRSSRAVCLDTRARGTENDLSALLRTFARNTNVVWLSRHHSRGTGCIL